MPRKSKKPETSVRLRKRGRPRKKTAPEALIPFEKHEVTTVEKFESLIKKPKTAESNLKNRRMNPATSERCYTLEEVEFMNALAEFKRASGRLFPTCSEILGVLRELGYEKVMKDGEKA